MLPDVSSLLCLFLVCLFFGRCARAGNWNLYRWSALDELKTVFLDWIVKPYALGYVFARRFPLALLGLVAASMERTYLQLARGIAHAGYLLLWSFLARLLDI
jgi:hypothetical protein